MSANQLQTEFASLLRFIVSNKSNEASKVPPCVEPPPQKCVICGHFRGDHEKIIKRTIGTRSIAASSEFSGVVSWVPLAPFGVNLSSYVEAARSSSPSPNAANSSTSTPPSFLALCGNPGEEYSCRRHFELGLMYVSPRGPSAAGGFVYVSTVHPLIDEREFTVRTELNRLELLALRTWSCVTVNRSVNKKELSELLELRDSFLQPLASPAVTSVTQAPPVGQAAEVGSPASVASPSEANVSQQRPVASDAPWHAFVVPLGAGRTQRAASESAAALAAEGSSLVVNAVTGRLASVGRQPPSSAKELQNAVRECTRAMSLSVDCNAFSCRLGQAQIAEGGFHGFELRGFTPYLSLADFSRVSDLVKPFAKRSRLEVLLRTRAGETVKAVCYPASPIEDPSVKFYFETPLVDRIITRVDSQLDMRLTGFLLKDITSLFEAGVSVSLGAVYCAILACDEVALSLQPLPRIPTWSSISCPYVDIIGARCISTTLATFDESGQANVIFLDKLRDCTWTPSNSGGGGIGVQHTATVSAEKYCISLAAESDESVYQSFNARQSFGGFNKQAQKRGSALARFLLAADPPRRSCHDQIGSGNTDGSAVSLSRQGNAFVVLPACDQSLDFSSGRMLHLRSCWTKPTLPARAVAQNMVLLRSLQDGMQKASVACSCPVGNLSIILRPGKCTVSKTRPLRVELFQPSRLLSDVSSSCPPRIPSVFRVTVSNEAMEYVHMFKTTEGNSSSGGVNELSFEGLQHIESWRIPKVFAGPLYLLDPRAPTDTSIVFAQQLTSVDKNLKESIHRVLCEGLLAEWTTIIPGEGKFRVTIEPEENQTTDFVPQQQQQRLEKDEEASASLATTARQCLECRIPLASTQARSNSNSTNISSSSSVPSSTAGHYEPLATAFEAGLRAIYAGADSVGRRSSVDKITDGIMALASSADPAKSFSLRISLLRLPSYIAKGFLGDMWIYSEWLRRVSMFTTSSAAAQKGFAVRAQLEAAPKNNITELSVLKSGVATKASISTYSVDITTPGGGLCNVEAQTFIAGTHSKQAKLRHAAAAEEVGLERAFADAAVLHAHIEETSTASRYLAISRLGAPFSALLNQFGKNVSTFSRWRCPYKSVVSPEKILRDASRPHPSASSDNIFIDVDEAYALGEKKIKDVGKGGPSNMNQLPSGPEVEISLTITSMKKAGDVTGELVEQAVRNGLQAVDELMWELSLHQQSVMAVSPTSLSDENSTTTAATSTVAVFPNTINLTDGDVLIRPLTQIDSDTTVDERSRAAKKGGGGAPAAAAAVSDGPNPGTSPLLTFLLCAVQEVMDGEAAVVGSCSGGNSTTRFFELAELYRALDVNMDALTRIPFTPDEPQKMVTAIVTLMPAVFGATEDAKGQREVQFALGASVMQRLSQLVEFARVNRFLMRSDVASCAWVQLPEALGELAPSGTPVLFGQLLPNQLERDARKFLPSIKTAAANSALIRQVRWKHSLVFPASSSFVFVPKQWDSVGQGLELQHHVDDATITSTFSPRQPYATDMLSLVVGRHQGEPQQDLHITCPLLPSGRSSPPGILHMGAPLVTFGGRGRLLGFATSLSAGAGAGSLRVLLPRLALRGAFTVI